MKKAIFCLIAISVVILSGCSTIQKPETMVIKNPRIIERDLTQSPNEKKVTEKITKQRSDSVVTKVIYKEVPGECKSVNTTQAHSMLVPTKNQKKYNTLKYDVIEFANESVLIQEQHKLDDIVDNLNKDEHIYLIGHSHGRSKYQTDNLAIGRTNVVFYYLKQKGIEPERIHKLASWSNTSSSDSPARGVQVYVINKNTNNEEAQLFLALL